MRVETKYTPTQKIEGVDMARWEWKRRAFHMRDPETKQSICWVEGKRGVILTNNPDMVTCLNCRKIMEEENEGQETTR